MTEKTKTKTRGTIAVLGDILPDELICPYKCDDGDVCVDSKTGKCKVCGRVFDIHPTNIVVPCLPQVDHENDRFFD